MRITRDTLLKIARERAAALAKSDRQITCIYLTGSLLGSDPFLGGAADIDLVVIHPARPTVEREFVAVTEDIHLDIIHHYQDAFQQPRHLRADPWLGYPLCMGPLCLHDVQHWFEFTQASVCAQFNRPEYIFQRAQPLAEKARQAWLKLHAASALDKPEHILTYLGALEDAANAVALLGGPPLSERRALLEFPPRALAVGHPGLSAGLVDLLPASQMSAAEWAACLKSWEDALAQVQHLHACPPDLQTCRKSYLTKAAAFLWNENPAAAVWILLRSWNAAASRLPAKSAPRLTWQEALPRLGFDAPGLRDLVVSLDSYLDVVEETLEVWGQQNGAALAE
jgi:hypothetical protein